MFINNFPLRLATVPFFATIVFDEARPKVLCIHTKLIVVFRVCYRNQNSKNVSFCSFRQTKLFSLDHAGKRPYILVISHVLTVAVIGLVWKLMSAIQKH